ncbi:hypothetical protein [Notoacmeibacter sp. MSK16QG-6]|uniref:hypothetical protein n=1 Tax=Notoacmeibacter sp. MSK16QG-6 TaxID=2957982 RepID=UPI0020A21BE2|nr:hypothetical protein [Notoacmeibacter sp. MSK16QG-6]MCP1198425.1 hypothetical protein [Notoacmeibacter sp. MSK16QG-6]
MNYSSTVSIRLLLAGAASLSLGLASIAPAYAGNRAVSCYQPVHHPAQYKAVTKRVQVAPARRSIEHIPAVTKTVWQTIVTQPARKEWRYVPAVTRGVKKRVLLRPAERVPQHTPAVTKIVHETITVPGGYGWEWRWVNGKKTLCKVKLPARHQTVARQVTVRPAIVSYKVIPPRYGTEWTEEIVQPARTEEVYVPAVRERVARTVVVRPASERVHTIPAEYATVTEQVQVRSASTAWRNVSVPRHCRN